MTRAPLTPDQLRRRVLAYLQTHPTTLAHTRRLYGHKIDQAVAAGGDRAALVAALDEALGLGERYGFVDDARYAESRARRGLARGTAPGRVVAQLAAKGVTGGVARAGIAAATDGDPVRMACDAYVRRRRLGHWRPADARAAEHGDDLARLARAGFPYGVAKAALAGAADDVAPGDDED